MKPGTANPASAVATLILILLALALPTASAADELSLAVTARGTHAPEAAVVQVTAGSTVTQHETTLVNGRGELSIEAEHPGKLRFQASAPGCWSPEVAAAEPFTDPVELVLWPAVDVSATVRAPESADPPDDIRLTLSRPPALPTGAPDQPESADVQCSIAERRLAGCRAPAGHWHLRIKAAGYVPVRLWNLELAGAETVELGKITLQRGASLFGRVVTSDGSLLSPRARVELRPLLDRNLGGARPELAEEIESLTETTSINDWGYFQLDTIPPRTYQITAVDDGFMPAPLQRLEIRAGQHVELLEPLVLQRALQLVVIVSPLEDLEGEPWSASAIDASVLGTRDTVASGPAEHGEWRSPPLAPGPYHIEVSDSKGNRLAFQEMALTETTTTAWIELEHVPISGKVVISDDPLAAHLGFQAHDGTMVDTEADDEGLFEVVLPAPGTWLVNIRNESLNIDCRRIEVEIEPEHSGRS